MIQVHILKNKAGEYYSVILGKNGEVLHSSEGIKDRTDMLNNIYRTRQALMGNMTGEEVDFCEGFLLIQDDSREKSVTISMDFSGKVTDAKVTPGPKYIPGKNPA